MKQVIKQSLVTLTCFLILNGCFAQTKDSFSVAGGKWVVCADTSLNSSYDCTKPYSGFEFMTDGTYKEYPRTVTDPKHPILTGKWMLNNNVFTLDQDDVPGTKELPKTYNITWVDKNHFYSSNKEGQQGPPMFVYFQRMP